MPLLDVTHAMHAKPSFNKVLLVILSHSNICRELAIIGSITIIHFSHSII